jgi:tryptophan-rich sensory protein
MLAAAPTAAVAATALAGGWFTRTGLRDHRDWYRCVSPYAPPSWVFVMAWTFLYVRQALVLSSSHRWATHLPVLILHAVWCGLFFTGRLPGAALGVLLVIALWTALHRDEFGSPLLYWTFFAVALNTVAVTRSAGPCRSTTGPRSADP